MDQIPLHVPGNDELAYRLQVIRRIVEARDLARLVDLLPTLSPQFQVINYFGIGVYNANEGQPWVRIRSAYLRPWVEPGNEDASISAALAQAEERGFPVENSAAGQVLQTGERLSVPDLDTDDRYPALFSLYRAARVRSLLYLPLRTARSFPGCMVCGSGEPHAFGPEITAALEEIADFVALSLENHLSLDAAIRAQRAAEQERNRLHVMLRIAHAMAAGYEVSDIQQAITEAIYQHVHHRFGSVCEYDAEHDLLRMWYVNVADEQVSQEIGTIIPMEKTVSGAAYREQHTVFFRLGADDERYPYSADIVRRYQSDWMCAVPVSTPRRQLGVMNLGGELRFLPTAEDLGFLEHLASHLGLAIERSLVLREMQSRAEDLERKNLALEHEIEDEHNFDEIVGRSSTLRAVLAKVEAVARTDATVLIQGESGTGKELIARAVHQRSRRSSQPFVKVSCAAIPAGLLESELFGHERGAFTGATALRQGRFELAHRGTIFLDEIGELPLELQAKLLRVLQEREFERVGSSFTRVADVRVLAATNRELRAMVAGGRFREDLYYRLSTFPLTVPPLRDRHGDIGLLIRYFVQLISRKLGRNVTKIPEFAMKAMERYSWPGNVRELQNFIERAVILSSGNTLNPPLSELDPALERPGGDAVTMEEAERKFIVQALEDCRWVVGGAQGAAARLGMKRTTLQSRMLKLGIRRLDNTHS
ncbi:MAG: sigma 54-interacting transcriptional regulator [Bryobacterales bacterium]|nr:sigma 54-interacting transcriptional regulator [Bryobacterales bacterium]